MDLLIKNQLKRAYVIFILIIICHIQGCMIYAVFRVLEIWIPPLDFGSISTNVFDDEHTFMHHYAKMFYHSTLVYSMVDISGRSLQELLVMSALIIVSALINAIIYGQFFVLTQELKEDTNEFLRKLDLVNTVMQQEAIPKEIRMSVR